MARRLQRKHVYKPAGADGARRRGGWRLVVVVAAGGKSNV
jgi:hypothetical protein